MKKILGLLTVLSFYACQEEAVTINGLNQTEAWDVIQTERQAIKDEGVSKSCNDDDDWNFVALGDKACGGPWEYIPYSTKLNENNFLQRVQDFNDLEEEYNSAFEVFSNCDSPSAPIDVICVDGGPELVY